MTIEVASYINQLNIQYPRSSDLLKEGDDHIRMIKNTIKTTFPYIDKAIKMSADKINLLDTNITGNTSLTFTRGFSVSSGITNTVDFGGNILQRVGDPKATQDAVNKQYADSILSRIYPVGSLYMTTINYTAQQMNTMMGFGTWTAHYPGAALVSMGPNLYTNIGTLKTAGQIGAATVTLTTANLPAHTHSINHDHPRGTTSSNGGHSHTVPISRDGDGGNGNDGNARYAGMVGSTATSAVANHSHTFDVPSFTGSSGSVGNGVAINNIQPSIGVYVWRRIS